MTESVQGIAYGATFGTSHPYNFQVIAGASLSALVAEYMAVHRVITIVPSYLTWYVVCISRRQIDLQIHMNTWFRSG